MDRGPAPPYIDGQQQATDASRHIDVREHRTNVRVSEQQDHGFSGISGLNNPRASRFEIIDYREADKRFVLDDENCNELFSH